MNGNEEANNDCYAYTVECGINRHACMCRQASLPLYIASHVPRMARKYRYETSFFKFTDERSARHRMTRWISGRKKKNQRYWKSENHRTKISIWNISKEFTDERSRRLSMTSRISGKINDIGTGWYRFEISFESRRREVGKGLIIINVSNLSFQFAASLRIRLFRSSVACEIDFEDVASGIRGNEAALGTIKTFQGKQSQRAAGDDNGHGNEVVSLKGALPPG